MGKSDERYLLDIRNLKSEKIDTTPWQNKDEQRQKTIKSTKPYIDH